MIKNNRSPHIARAVHDTKPCRTNVSKLLIWLLAALLCCATVTIAAPPFKYTHVLGTGDPTPDDPNSPKVPMDSEVTGCDVGILTDTGFMSNVCSFDGDANADGGVFFSSEGEPFRSFRREDPLPGQPVGFETAIIPFGIPSVHPTTGDTFVTAFFDRIPDDVGGHANRPGGRQEGVYIYDRVDHAMQRIADTTAGSPPPPGRKALWTDFSNNVVTSTAGGFFIGDYRLTDDGRHGQGIYHYHDGRLVEVVGDPASVSVPGQTTTFSDYRAITANAESIFFVGRWACDEKATSPCPEGVYAVDIAGSGLRTVIESGSAVPGVGTFRQFAVEPNAGIFHHSIATNASGEMVLVANLDIDGATRQGIVLLKPAGDQYTTSLILLSQTHEPELLVSMIDSLHSVAINSRGEITFTVANTSNGNVPEKGLVFYRNDVEGPLSVFKQGDAFLADLVHPGEATSGYGAMVAGSQALDSSSKPRLYFRHAYVFEGTFYSMMVLATFNPPS